MVGINTNFYCPHCNYNSIVNLGLTQMVYYKNKRLALDFCPKCNTKVAFEIISKNENPAQLGHLFLNDAGIKMKTNIVDIISSNMDILSQREEQIFDYVYSKLKENYSDDYLNKNFYTIRTILECVLANETNSKSYIYDEIKNECKDGGCVAY